MDSYFSQLDDKSVISIPFLNLLYKTYPALMVRLVIENYSVLYGHILRFKHPLFFEAVRQSPQLLVDCVRIHLERIDVIDIFNLNFGSDLLTPFINDKTYDSILSSNIQLSDYELQIAPQTYIDSQIIRQITNEILNSAILNDFNDRQLTRADLLDWWTTSADVNAPLVTIQQWLNNNFNYINNTSDVIVPLAAQQAPPPPPVHELAATKISNLINKLRINNLVMHNAILAYNAVNDNVLYEAFRLYPLSIVIMEYNNTNRIMFQKAISTSFFRDATNAITFYRIASHPQLLDVYRPNNAAIIAENVRKFREYDYLKYSLMDVEPFVDIIDEPSNDIKKHNAAQLANKLLGNNYNEFLDEVLAVTNNPKIDTQLFLQAIGDKISLIPSNIVIPNLVASLEYYSSLIPQSSLTAILLLLLYNSSNYNEWIEVFKKHRETMRQILTRSSLLSEEEKATILDKLI